MNFNIIWIIAFMTLANLFTFGGIFKYFNETISIIGLFIMTFVGILLFIVGVLFIIAELLQQILNNQKSKGGKE